MRVSRAQGELHWPCLVCSDIWSRASRAGRDVPVGPSQPHSPPVLVRHTVLHWTTPHTPARNLVEVEQLSIQAGTVAAEILVKNVCCVTSE